MKYTVVCVCVLADEFARSAKALDLEPVIEHVEADNVPEAEFEVASRHFAELVPTRQLRFLAVFEGHLTDLKSDGQDSAS